MTKTAEQVVAKALTEWYSLYRSETNPEVVKIVTSLREAGLLAETRWQYGLQDSDGFVSFRNLSLKSLRKRAKQTEEMIVRRRPAGPWIPVEVRSE